MRGADTQCLQKKNRLESFLQKRYYKNLIKNLISAK